MAEGPPGLHLPLRTARPIWQDARKTSRRAQRLRGSLPSGCHGRPRPCAPGDQDETGLCRISCSGLTTRYMRRVEQDASSGEITCTIPHAKHRRYGAPRSRPRRSRPASALPPKFRRRRRRPCRGSDGPQRAATRPVRSASDWNVEDWNVFLYRVLCDSMYHPDGT